MTALAGRVIVITGGASGIGAATARLCAARGAQVVIADVDDAGGDALARDLTRLALSAAYVHVDVTHEADCERLMQATTLHCGPPDVLITCAGILQGAYVDIAELDLDVFQRVQDVNVRGTFLAVKHAVAAMGDRGGTILLVASGAGVSSRSSSVAYGTSKAAVHGLGFVAPARLAGRPIRINTVCPGNIATPLKLANVEDEGRAHGWSRATVDAAQQELRDPDGVARVLAFLASDEADYVEGTVFTS